MNTLNTEQDILNIIYEDEWMMEILRIVASLNLPDWWIGAGFVRSKVWDYLHEYTKKTSLPDVDVIYFDSSDLSETTEKEITKKLLQKMPYIQWQVKNQARMHLFHADVPYKNSTEGLSRWVETATCIGVSLDKNNELQLTSPLGIEDLVHLIVRPNPTIPSNLVLFKKRVRQKHWLHLWPLLKVVLE